MQRDFIMELSIYLADRIELYGQAGMGRDPAEYFYELIEGFKRRWDEG